MPLTRCGPWGLLHKLGSYRISKRVSSLIESFLWGRSIKIVINAHFSVTHETKILSPTLSLFYIYNDLTKMILRSLLNIYATDITIYAYTSKYLEVPNS